MSSPADRDGFEIPSYFGRTFARCAASFFLVVFVGAFLALCYFVFFGLASAPVPDLARFEIPLEKLRVLALESSEPLPLRLRAHLISEDPQWRGSVVAGESWNASFRRGYVGFAIEFEDRTVLVDAPYSSRTAPEMRAAFDDVIDAADRIVFTHTHADHVGGVARSDAFERWAPKLILTERQLAEPRYGLRQLPLRDTERILAVAGDRPVRVAPGVVLLPAPGNTRGSQMVFVMLSSGDEWLMVGDVVWSLRNLTALRGRPHWMAGLILREDEAAVADQIRALADLRVEGAAAGFDSRPRVLASHDVESLEAWVAEGVLAGGLGFARSAIGHDLESR